jgi:thioredoxin reductase (NADPH)
VTAPEVPREIDALVIGAGPAGLFAVFELGLREIRSEVVDALPFAGGQCVELYGDKPIYDIPALPFCTGRELTERLLKQAAPFGPVLHLGHQVAELRVAADQRWHVRTALGLEFLCGAVVLAAGVGAFLPRKLKLPGLDAHEGTQLLYHAGPDADFAGEAVVVAGAGDRALALAAALAARVQAGDARAPARVTLLHRREVFDAEPATLAAFEAQRAAGTLSFVAGQPTGVETHADGRLAALTLLSASGQPERLPVDRLVVLQGLSPKLGPLADWGVAMDHRQVVVDTATFVTSLPGVFAIGDVVTYPGKQRLILSAFHEGALAAAGVAAHLSGQPVGPLEYTTSSARIHRLLGVAHPAG